MFYILLYTLVGTCGSHARPLPSGFKESLHIDGDVVVGANFQLDQRTITHDAKLLRKEQSPARGTFVEELQSPVDHTLMATADMRREAVLARSGPFFNVRQNEIAFREGIALLKAGGVDFVAAYGSLLGIIRDGALMEDDDSVDFVASESTFHLVASALMKSPRQLKLLRDTDVFLRAVAPDWGPLDVYRFHQMNPVFAMNSTQLQFGCDYWNQLLLSQAETFPSKVKSLQGVEIPIPNKPEDFLSRLYGSDWQVKKSKEIEIGREGQSDYHRFCDGAQRYWAWFIFYLNGHGQGTLLQIHLILALGVSASLIGCSVYCSRSRSSKNYGCKTFDKPS